MVWAAIWQEGKPQPLGAFSTYRGAPEEPLDALTLCLEIAMPRRRRVPVRLWQGASTKARQAISVYVMPDGALRLVHGDALDVETEAGFLAPGQILALRLIVCARGRRDVVDAVNVDTGRRHRFRCGVASSPRLEDALPAAPGFTDMARVAAIATHVLPTTDLPGLESGARIETPEGPMLVEDIRPGMVVLTDTGAEHVVRWTDARDRLCIGRSAPVLLRAPYFGLGADICVTPETRLKRHGADVEYLAGTDTVLVRAADLASGPAARFERSKPVRRFHHIMLDDPACLNVWRCKVETAFLSEVLASQDSGAGAARPDAKDCVPSLPLLDRSAARALLARGAGAQSFVI
jgi:hypothetical protein